MPLWQYLAAMEGYKDIMSARNAECVWTGFWSGYYSGDAKHKKKPADVLKSIEKATNEKQTEHAEVVDVDQYLAREAVFKDKFGG